MPTYWTDEGKQNQQQDRPGRSLLAWIQRWIRIPNNNNNNQQQRRTDNAEN